MSNILNVIRDELLKQEINILISEKPHDKGGQKVVYFASVDEKEVVLKVIDVTPIGLYDELEINDKFEINSLSSENKELLEKHIQYLSRRITTEIEMGKACNFMPKLLFLNKPQVIFNGYNIYIYYIEEKVRGANLKYKKTNYFFSETIIFLDQLIQQIEEMSLKGYVHRDIKPKNIIYNEKDNTYTIIDGGICKNINDQFGNTIGIVEHLGTYGYSAPEQKNVTSDYKWNFKTDIYPLGIIAIEMLEPDLRNKFDLIKDIEKLKEYWDNKYKNETIMQDFFSSIIVKLIHPKRFRRFSTIETLKNELLKFKEVK